MLVESKLSRVFRARFGFRIYASADAELAGVSIEFVEVIQDWVCPTAFRFWTLSTLIVTIGLIFNSPDYFLARTVLALLA